MHPSFAKTMKRTAGGLPLLIAAGGTAQCHGLNVEQTEYPRDESSTKVQRFRSQTFKLSIPIGALSPVQVIYLMRHILAVIPLICSFAAVGQPAQKPTPPAARAISAAPARFSPVAAAVDIADQAARQRGGRTQVAVLGTAHLRDAPKTLSAPAFELLITRLTSQVPNIRCCLTRRLKNTSQNLVGIVRTAWYTVFLGVEMETPGN